MDTKERLLYIRNILNLSRAEFSRAVKISYETVKDIEDKTIKQLSAKNANLIAGAIVQDSKGNIRILNEENPIKDGEYFLSPAWLAYGVGQMFDKPVFTFTSETDGANVELIKTDRMRYFTLKDESMTPKYNKGAYYAVNTAKTELVNGEEYCVIYKKKEYLRQINVLGLDKIQLNAYYKPEIYSFDVSKKDIEVIGTIEYLVIVP